METAKGINTQWCVSETLDHDGGFRQIVSRCHSHLPVIESGFYPCCCSFLELGKWAFCCSGCLADTSVVLGKTMQPAEDQTLEQHICLEVGGFIILGLRAMNKMIGFLWHFEDCWKQETESVNKLQRWYKASFTLKELMAHLIQCYPPTQGLSVLLNSNSCAGYAHAPSGE